MSYQFIPQDGAVSQLGKSLRTDFYLQWHPVKRQRHNKSLKTYAVVQIQIHLHLYVLLQNC